MMDFSEMNTRLQAHFKEMSKTAKNLFEVECDKDELWNLYLDSFPAGTNEIFRERREHDCSCCRHFIKEIGNVVAINNGVIESVWDFKTDDETYQPVISALSRFVKSHKIANIYASPVAKIGTSHNFEMIDGKSHKWEHFYVELDSRFVFNKNSKSKESIQGDFRDTRNVFKRSLDEITEESLLTVLELISQNSLYKGEEWKATLEKFLSLKREYDSINDETAKEIYTWDKASDVGAVCGRIRNHSIGTLLVNISEDMDLDTAVKKYEAIVAPSNYKRPKAIYD